MTFTGYAKSIHDYWVLCGKPASSKGNLTPDHPWRVFKENEMAGWDNPALVKLDKGNGLGPLWRIATLEDPDWTMVYQIMETCDYRTGKWTSKLFVGGPVQMVMTAMHAASLVSTVTSKETI